MRYWMRWKGGAGGDPRPLTFPVPIEWWCTGQDMAGLCTICALVDSKGEKGAWAKVRKYWPEAEACFALERKPGWRPPPDRFPPKPPVSP